MNRTHPIRPAFRFFLDHAGYATPPGRAACALALARAERLAADLGYVAEWVWDDDADLSWMETPPTDQTTVEGCILRNQDGEHLASLWGITDADNAYRRVIEAELACEALA